MVEYFLFEQSNKCFGQKKQEEEQSKHECDVI